MRNPKNSLRVGVICGGNSSERKISLRSGNAVLKAVARLGYQPIKIDPSSSSYFKKLDSIDIALLTLHGRGGEDGQIQRVLERKRVPYMGSTSKSSAIAFDKIKAKKVFCDSKISTPHHFLLTSKNWKRVLSKAKFPLFVKPPKEGSSIGAFPVEDFKNSAVKLKGALKRFGTLLAEQKVCGREFTVGILGNQVLPVIELRPSRKFYDFRAKYTKGMTDYLVPAPIPKKVAKRMQQIALKVHKVLGLRDLSRVDMMMDEKSEKVFVLEANSLPGFTELSLLPKAARAVGISFEQVCQKLIDWAYARRKR